MMMFFTLFLHSFLPADMRHPAKGNQTMISEFILLGFSDDPKQQPFIFGLFFFMYLISVLGNLLIILAIRFDSHLHTPMYFFLSKLSFVDLCLTTTTLPKMLLNIQTQKKTISYAGCLTQIYFLILFAYMDSFLLTAMAFDRYMAICHPLHYTTAVSPQLCVFLVAGSWFITFLHSLLHTVMAARLFFCGDNEIPHFYCDLTPLLKLSCSDISTNEVLIFTVAVLLGLAPAMCIVVSYICIVSAVLKIPSAEGKRKAFSTCGSHLTVVTLFYGAGMGVHIQPSSIQSKLEDLLASVLYTVVTPMLNPFIYSLRNKDVKAALRKLFSCETIPTQKL
ncbi:olfactory receptor 1G1-like [Tachyglossus aculeatus]|uniref:olfactory receptor 1G1-like n=1 Tax=Tachyglossus aculeatus TaxID=9261 RepID=UPI0018F2F3AF|nr:olfactory receptor 1G1-like [Tachyglossus aculeatus]